MLIRHTQEIWRPWRLDQKQEVWILWQSSSSSMRHITPQTSCVLLSTVKVFHMISTKDLFGILPFLLVCLLQWEINMRYEPFETPLTQVTLKVLGQFQNRRDVGRSSVISPGQIYWCEEFEKRTSAVLRPTLSARALAGELSYNARYYFWLMYTTM